MPTFKIGIEAPSFETYLKKRIDETHKGDYTLENAKLSDADMVVSTSKETLERCTKEGVPCVQLMGTRVHETPVPGVEQIDVNRFVPSLINLLERKK